MKLWDTLYRALSSPRFFYLVVALLVFQALWIAFSAVYPMAFDEDFHLGIIKIYADQWLPFIQQQPVGADAYGAVARDTSYLFHYLMSFPYRLIALFTDSQATMVIALRLINITLFVAALIAWRKVARLTRLSPALTNVVLLLFVMIPIVPPLAAQINYDNLLLLLAAWVCVLVARILAAVQQTNLAASVRPFLCFMIVGIAASLVKYAFLPIFAAMVIYIMAYAWWRLRSKKIAVLRQIGQGWRHMQRGVQIVLVLALLVFGGLWVERYGLNIVRYQHPVPDCGAVLTTQQCLNYGPWGRDYRYVQQKTTATDPNPLYYIDRWTYGMWYRLFFTLNGNVPEARYQTYPPLPIVGIAGAMLIVGGLMMATWRIKGLRDQPLLGIFVVSSVGYVVVLWLQNYQMYLETGRAVAVNGRYLLLVMLPMAFVAAHAFSGWFGNRPRVKLVLAGLAVLAFAQGGLITFIARSSDTWYWPNQTVRSINQGAQRAIEPLVFDEDDVNVYFKQP